MKVVVGVAIAVGTRRRLFVVVVFEEEETDWGEDDPVDKTLEHIGFVGTSSTDWFRCCQLVVRLVVDALGGGKGEMKDGGEWD